MSEQYEHAKYGGDMPGMNAGGAVKVAEEFEKQLMEDGALTTSKAAEPEPNPGAFTPPTPLDLHKVVTEMAPTQEWIFDKVLPKKVMAGLAAQGGCGKSQLLLQIAVSLATGQDLFPFLKPVKAGRVLALFGEDDDHEVWRRFRRITRVFKLNDEGKNLFKKNAKFYCGQSFPLMGMSELGPVGLPSMDWLRGEVKEFKPNLLILDPKAQFFGLNENSNDETTRWYQVLSDLPRVADCSVLVSMHVAKMRQNDLDSAAGRGASANRDNVRTFFSMAPVDDTEARDFAFQNPRLFCKLELTKSNYAPQMENTVYFQRETGPDCSNENYHPAEVKNLCVGAR